MSERNSGSPDLPAGNKSRGKGAWAAAGLLLLLSKIKPVLLFLLKLGKPLGTMLLSVGAYALIYPWTFAVGFVLLIFVHELGHILAARRRGLPVSAPFFIPFLGALILMKRHPKDAETEAYIGIGGPLLGTAGAFVCYAAGWWSGQDIWFALAYTGFFLNLVNLLPIHPLDGGRIVTAVSRWLWLVGVVAGPLFFWRFGSFLFLLIWLVFLWEMYKKFFRNKTKGERYAVEGEYKAQADPALPSWYWAGESHKRELPFTAYCRMDGTHVAEFWWEPLSFRGELVLPQRCTIDKLLLTNVKRKEGAALAAGSVDSPGMQPDEVTFAVRMEGHLYEPPNYYEVPLRTRIRMGILYGGLIALLLYMTWQIGEAGLIVTA